MIVAAAEAKRIAILNMIPVYKNATSTLATALASQRQSVEGLKALRVEYINNFSYMTDHRVNNGGRMGGY